MSANPFNYLILIALLFVAYTAVKRRSSFFNQTGTKRLLDKLPADGEVAYLVCAFSMLGKLSQVDGTISDAEVQRVQQFIDTKLHLDKDTRALAIRTFYDGAESPLSIRDYAEAFHKHFPDRVQLCDQIITLLLHVSTADGVLSPGEHDEIKRAALVLGISPQGFERLKREAEATTPTVH